MLRKELTRPGWRAGLAVGFVLAGLAGLVCAAWLLDPDRLTPRPHRLAIGWWTALLLVTLAGLVTVSVLATPERTRRRQRIELTVIATGFALAAALSGLFALLDQNEHGFPGRTTLLSLIGGGAVLVGLVLSVGTALPRRLRATNRLGTVLALGLVAATAVPLVPTVDSWPDTSTTARAVRPADLPNEITRLAWTKPFHTKIDDVVPAGAGVAVVSGDRVLALDGPTGTVRWQYHRAGAGITGIVASPDRATLAIGVSADDHWVETLLVDAITGHLRVRMPTPPREGSSAPNWWSGAQPLLVNDALILADPDFTAYSTRTGQRIWRYSEQGGCGPYIDEFENYALPGGLLIPVFCPAYSNDRTEWYVLLDGATGREVWRTKLVTPADTQHAKYASRSNLSPDSTVLRVGISSSPAQIEIALDTSTGRKLPGGDLRIAGLLTDGLALVQGPDVDRQTIVNLRTGAVVGHSQADCLNGIILALGTGAQCLDDTDYIDLRERTPMVLVGPPGGAKHKVALPLGDPDPKHLIASPDAVAAPGAVVVWNQAGPPPGGTTNLVGLA